MSRAGNDLDALYDSLVGGAGRDPLDELYDQVVTPIARAPGMRAVGMPGSYIAPDGGVLQLGDPDYEKYKGWARHPVSQQVLLQGQDGYEDAVNYGRMAAAAQPPAAPEPFPMPESPGQALSLLKRAITEPGTIGRLLSGLNAGRLGYSSGAAEMLGTVFELAGDPVQSEAFRQAAGELGVAGQAGRSTAAGQLGGMAWDSVPAAAMIVASRGRAAGAVSPVVSRAASIAGLGTMGAASAGQGIQDYRNTVLARGGTPDPKVEAMIGAGYAGAEILFERIGIDATGEIVHRAAGEVTQALMRRDAPAIARFMLETGKAAGVNAGEEWATQVAQNLVSSTYDPARDPFEGSDAAAMMGGLQGLGFAGAGAAAGAGRVLARPTRAPAPPRASPPPPPGAQAPAPTPPKPLSPEAQRIVADAEAKLRAKFKGRSDQDIQAQVNAMPDTERAALLREVLGEPPASPRPSTPPAQTTPPRGGSTLAELLRDDRADPQVAGGLAQRFAAGEITREEFAASLEASFAASPTERIRRDFARMAVEQEFMRGVEREAQAAPALGGLDVADVFGPTGTPSTTTPMPLSRSDTGTPSRSYRSAETGRVAVSSSPTVVSSPHLSQDLEGGNQVSTEAPDSVRTSLQIAPSTTIGPYSTVPTGAASQTSEVRSRLDLGSIGASGRKSMQRSGSQEELTAWAQRAREPFDRLLRNIGEMVGAAAFKPSRVKSPESIARKVGKHAKTGRGVETFSDILGGRIAVRSAQQAQEIINRLNSLGYRVFDDENFLHHDKADYNGYRARHVQVDLGDITAELELVPSQVFDVQERGHLYYDVTRVYADRLSRGDIEAADIARFITLTEHATRLNQSAYTAFVGGHPAPPASIEDILGQLSDDEIEIVAQAKGLSPNEDPGTLRRKIAESVRSSEAQNRRIPAGLLPGGTDGRGRGDLDAGQRGGPSPRPGRSRPRGPRQGRVDYGAPEPPPGQPGGRGSGDGGAAEPAPGGERVPQDDAAAAADRPRGDGTAGRPQGVQDAAGDAGRPQAPVEAPAKGPVDPATLPPEQRNHVIPEGESVAPAGAVAKFRANLAAIRLLRTLESEKRDATPEEKGVLAKYTGWGWAGEYFNESNDRYAKQRAQLRELLTKEEWDAASASTLNAHYTSPQVVRPMWDLVKRLGFTGGRVLEPAAGSGNFLGMMPQDLAPATSFVGVELDSLTGRLLGKLYPQADVRVEGFQDARLANNSFDLAISNVPFGGFTITGQDYDDLLIHDYFFARALDKVKPGGLVVFVTSDGTLNKIRDGARVRGLLADKADLVGAIRLPNNAFAENAGTQVTTDIIVLRKKDGSPFKGEPFLNVEQVGTGTVEEDGATVEKPILVNEYFARHPEMALGEHSLEGTMYGSGDYALIAKRGVDLGKALAAAVERFPQGVMGQQQASADVGALKAEEGERPGSYIERDGQFFHVVGEEVRPADWLKEKLTGESWEEPIDAATRAKRIEIARAWMPLRAATRELLAAENNPGVDDRHLGALREVLNERYDAFVREHGTLNRTQSFREPAGFLAADPDYPLVQALETESERVRAIERGRNKGKSEVRTVFVKGPVFSKRIREPKRMPEKASSIEDAVSISMGWHNRVDPEIVAGLLGITPDQAAAQILGSGRAFLNPSSGTLEIRERYLAGNVRRKLREARAAAKGDERYRGNVSALEAVQPRDVTVVDIAFTLASRWMPAEVSSAFATDLFGTPARVEYVRAANGFTVDVGEATGPMVSTWGIRYQDRLKLSGADILQHALNGTFPALSHTEGSGDNKVTRPLPQETAAAKALIERMSREFVSWVRTADAKVSVRGEELPVAQAAAKQYNEQMNAVVPVEYDGSYLTLPGAAKTVRRIPHRMSVVARILQEGSAVMAHGVGSGKTFSIIVSAMELRRLGLSKKPLIVVQKATIGQFARSFKEAYPDARILVATEKTFAAKNRKRLMSQVALGDWDAIIVTQPQFERIPNNPKNVAAYIRQRLAELEEAIAAERARAKGKKGRKSPTQKQLEAMKKALEARLAKLIAGMAERKDRTVFFEDLGVDYLFIDEAHAYKNVPIITRKKNVKGIPGGFSQRALDTDIKTKQIHAKQNGRGVVLATGTPITNTMAEAYVMLQLATPKVLEEYGIHNFDEFANTFGQTKSDVEFTWSGAYKSISRFKKFVNGQELVRLIRSGFDVKMGNKELGLKVPDIKGGSPELVILPPTPAYDTVSGILMDAAAAFESAKGKEKLELTWVPITTMQAGMAAALDPRLIDPDLPDAPGSKLHAAADRIAAIHEEWEAKRGTQIVFADRFFPMNVEKLRSLAGGTSAGPVDIDATEEPSEDVLDALRDEPDQDAAQKADEEARAQAEASAYKEARFNLYKDLRAKLVERGIPAEQIAIIHEADTDKKREALFDRVKKGEVRVIIGSTEKLGVGVNIQDRLVAAHHLDPPRTMTPAMMEQRDGRIIRQGNLFATPDFDGEKNAEYIPGFEVQVVRYGVEKSMDTGIYQLLENKQRFIVQALTNRGVGREFDDPGDEVLLSMQQMKAMLTGDQRVIRLVELKQKVDELRSEKDGHERQLAARQGIIAAERGKARGLLNWAAEREDKGKKAAAMSSPDVRVTVGKRTVQGLDEAKELLKPLWESLGSQASRGTIRPTEKFDIGPYGMELAATKPFLGDGDVQFTVTNWTDFQAHEKLSIRAPGPGRMFSGLRRYADETESDVAQARKEAEAARRKADQVESEPKPPFEKQKELDAAERELVEIESDLTGEKKPAGGVVLRPGETPPRSRAAKAAQIAQRLEAWADEQMRQVRRSAIPRGRGVGATTLPEDVVRIVGIVAARALSRTITGGVALTKLVNETIADLAPEMKDQADIIRRAVKRFLEATKGDAENFDAVYHALANPARTKGQARKEKREQGEARRKVVEGMVERDEPATVTASEALAGSLKAQERAAGKVQDQAVRAIRAEIKAAYKAGVAAGARSAERQIPGLLRTIRDQARRIPEAMELARRGGKNEERAAQDVRDAIRQQVIDYAKTLPPVVRGKLLSSIQGATTPMRYVAALRRLQRELWRWSVRRDWKWINRATARKKLGASSGMTEALRKKLRGLRAEAYEASAVIRSEEDTTGIRQAAVRIAAIRQQIGAEIEAARAYAKQIKGARGLSAAAIVLDVAEKAREKNKPLDTGGELRDPRRSWIVRRWQGMRDVRNAAAEIQGPNGTLEAVLWDRPEHAEERFFGLIRDKRAELERVVKEAGYKSIADAHEAMSGFGGRGVTRMVEAEIGGERVKITLGDALALVAHWSDPNTAALILERDGRQEFQSQRGKYSRGVHPSPADIERLAQQVDPDGKYRKMIEGIKDIFESMRPETQRAFRTLHGYEFEEVEKRWPRQRNIQHQSATQELPETVGDVIFKMLENDGMFESRKQITGVPIVLRDPISVALDQIERSARVAALAVPVRDAANVLLSREIREVVSSRFGSDFYDMLKRQLMAISRNDQHRDTAVAALNSAAAVKHLALNLSTWAYNAVSTIRMLPYLGVKDWTAGMAAMTSGKIGIDTLYKSGYFHDRYHAAAADRYSGVEPLAFGTTLSTGFLGELRKAWRNARNRDTEAIANLRRAAGSFMGVMNFFDSLAARTAWGAYDARARRLHPDWDEARRTRWVAMKARRLIRETQNGGSPLDMALDPTGARGKGASLFTLFTTDAFKARNRVVRAYRQSTARGNKVLAAELVSWYVGYKVGSLAWTAVSAAIAAALGWDDDDAERLAKRVANPSDDAWRLAEQLVGMVSPVMGQEVVDLIEQAVRGRRGNGETISAPSLDMINDTGSALVTAVRRTSRYLDDEEQGKRVAVAWAKFVNAAAGAAGLNPLDPLLRRVMREVEEASD